MWMQLVSCYMEWNIKRTILFIEDYHNSPELWNNKITDYKDNKLKNDKLKHLASKYECPVLEVKKKIKNLRSAFHREHKKLQASKKSDSSVSKKVKWFAYEPLSFLSEVDVVRLTTSTANNGDDPKEEDDLGSDSQDTEVEVHEFRNQHLTSNKPDCNKKRSTGKGSEVFLVPKKRIGKNKRFTSPLDCEEKACDIQKNTCQRDECSTYGEHVANELRNLCPRARTIVKHLMNNILFKAAMGKYDAENVSNTRTAIPFGNYQNDYESESDRLTTYGQRLP